MGTSTISFLYYAWGVITLCMYANFFFCQKMRRTLVYGRYSAPAGDTLGMHCDALKSTVGTTLVGMIIGLFILAIEVFAFNATWSLFRWLTWTLLAVFLLELANVRDALFLWKRRPRVHR